MQDVVDKTSGGGYVHRTFRYVYFVWYINEIFFDGWILSEKLFMKNYCKGKFWNLEVWKNYKKAELSLELGVPLWRHNDAVE